MAINNIVPRVHGEGKLGISNKKWEEINAINVSSSTITSTKVRVEDLLTTSDQDLLTSGNNIQISKNIDGQYEISSNALSSIQTASTIQAGIIQIASTQEISVGTSNDKAVTPSQLKSEIKLSDGNNSEFQLTDNSGDFISASIRQDENGNVLPKQDNTVNIGSKSNKIKSIFLANNTATGFDGTYDSLINKPNFAGGINYKSTYDANTNTPPLTLVDNEVGDLYKVSVAGNIGSISLLAGDHIIFNSSVTTSTLSDLEAHIDKIDNTETVTSVNNQVGSVEIGFFDLTDTSSSIPQDGNYVVAVNGSTLSLESSNSLTKWEEDANGDLIPTLSSTYSIGSVSNRVKDLYLTNNSINFESGSLSVTQGTINFAGNALAKYSDIKRNFVDLEDVNASSITSGQFLKFSGDKFITEPPPSGESSLYEDVVILYNDDADSSNGDVSILNGLTTNYIIQTPAKNTLYEIKAKNTTIYDTHYIQLPGINDSNKGSKLTIENNYGNRTFNLKSKSPSLIYDTREINSAGTSLYTLEIGYYVELVINKNNDWLITKKGLISDKDIVFDISQENLANSILTYDGSKWKNDRQSYYKDFQFLEVSRSLTYSSNYLYLNSAEGKRHYKLEISGGQLNIGQNFTTSRRLNIISNNTTDYPIKDSFYGSIFKLEVTSTDPENKGHADVGFHGPVVSLLKDNLTSPDSNDEQYHDLYAIKNYTFAGYLRIIPGLVYTVIYEKNSVYLVDIERNNTGDSYRFNNGNLTLTSGSLYLDGTKLLTASDAISSTSFYSTDISTTLTVPQITDVRRQHYNITNGNTIITIGPGSGATGGIFSARNNSTSIINLNFSGITCELADGTQVTGKIEIKPNVTRAFVWISDTLINETDVTALEYMSDVNINSPQTGQVLKYDGSSWLNSSSLISDMSDVSLTSSVSGQFLKYDGNNWINSALPSASQTQAGIIAVCRDTGFANSQLDNYLTRTMTVSQLINENYIPNEVFKRRDLAHVRDVNINSPQTGQVLKYNGTNWVNDADNTGSNGTYLPGLSDDQIHTITLGTGVDTATGSITTQYDLVPGLTNSGSLGTIDKRFAEVNSNNINVVGLNTFVEPGVYTFSTEGGSESILGITSNRGASVLKLNTLSGSLSLSTETALNSPFTADVMIDLPYELNSEIANLTIPVTTSTSPMTYKFEKVEQSLVDGSGFYKVKSAFMLDENIESFTDTTKNEATPAIASVPCKTYIFISRIADTLKTVNLGAPERIGQKFIIKNLSTSINEISLQPTAGITFDDGQITSIAAQNNDALTLVADSMTNWILV
jgi:hypothetical protein